MNISPAVAASSVSPAPAPAPAAPAAPVASPPSDLSNLGTVKWFNSPHGFGFITNDANGSDVYVQYQDILIPKPGLKELQEKQHVVYDVVPAAKGPQAAHVEVRGPHGETPLRDALGLPHVPFTS